MRCQRVLITEKNMEFLKAAGDAGLNFSEATAEMGMRQDTVRAALKRQNRFEEITDYFDGLQVDDIRGIRVIDDCSHVVVPPGVVARWMSTGWRVSV